MATVNLASKYSTKVDEKFQRASQAALVTNNDYEFSGVRTVNVYSIPTVPMGNYRRDGANRYGTPGELGNSVQELTVKQDRSWTFTIDKGNKTQSQMVMDAGKAVSRQLAQVVIPEYDKFIFRKLAASACGNTGHSSTTAVTKTNAYEQFLAGQEVLGDANVPDAGRVALCSYKFANLLKQDSAFMKYGNLSQEMILKGILGEVDGTKIVKVPASRLPSGCDFILTHPVACCAPKQLSEYKIHTDPVGISGWLAEGRVIYDAFVLYNKADAIFYHGSSAVTEETTVTLTGDGSKTTFAVSPILRDITEVKVDGTTTTAYTYDSFTGEITFATAPGASKAVTIKGIE